MKRRKRTVPVEPLSKELYSKKAFEALALQQGYAEGETDGEEEAMKFFLEKLKEELRDAVRVALLDADKKGQRALTTSNIDAIHKTVKTFTITK